MSSPLSSDSTTSGVMAGAGGAGAGTSGVAASGHAPSRGARADAAASSTEAALWFTGTGTSSGVPLVSCLTKRPITCETCSRAQFEVCSKDKRGNTGAIVQVPAPRDARGTDLPTTATTTIAIDCGKRFWESALHLFSTERSLHTIDAILLTHDHLDATACLDDMRDLCRARDGSIDVYCSQATLDKLTTTFPFLVDRTKATGGGDVADLVFHTFTPGKPFTVQGVSVTPFNVLHGPQYYCTAFRIGDLVWMSDVSSIPDDVRHFIRGANTVVLDTLWLKPEAHKSHFGLEQALAEVKSGFGVKHRPRRTLLIGMNHTVPHYETNTNLRKRGFHDVQLAYDGQRISFNFSAPRPQPSSGEAEGPVVE